MHWLIVIKYHGRESNEMLGFDMQARDCINKTIELYIEAALMQAWIKLTLPERSIALEAECFVQFGICKLIFR